MNVKLDIKNVTGDPQLVFDAVNEVLNGLVLDGVIADENDEGWSWVNEREQVPWPVEIGHHYIEIPEGKKIKDPSRVDEFLFGPLRLSWTLHRDGGIEVREQ